METILKKVCSSSDTNLSELYVEENFRIPQQLTRQKLIFHTTGSIVNSIITNKKILVRKNIKLLMK